MVVVADTVVLIIKYDRILLMVLLIIMKKLKSFLVKKKTYPIQWLEAIPFGAAHTYYSSCKGVLPGYVDKWIVSGLFVFQLTN